MIICDNNVISHDFKTSLVYLRFWQSAMQCDQPSIWHQGPISQQFMSSFLKSHKSSFYSNFNSNNGNIRSQICTCHDSRAVVTCAKLWPDWIIIFYVRTLCIFFTSFGFGAHKSCVKWLPDIISTVCHMGTENFNQLERIFTIET